jgi:hypothetical protein
MSLQKDISRVVKEVLGKIPMIKIKHDTKGRINNDHYRDAEKFMQLEQELQDDLDMKNSWLEKQSCY